MEPHPEIADLVAEIDAFLACRGMTPTDFGMLSIGDPNLYRHLTKNGREPRRATLDKIRAFMERKGRAA